LERRIGPREPGLEKDSAKDARIAARGSTKGRIERGGDFFASIPPRTSPSDASGKGAAGARPEAGRRKTETERGTSGTIAAAGRGIATLTTPRRGPRRTKNRLPATTGSGPNKTNAVR